MNAPKEQPDVASRATSFAATNDRSPPPASVQTFGAIFLVLWLVMLGLVYWARRRQVALRSVLDQVERSLAAQRK